MPRLITRPPKYSLHKASGQAVVKFCGRVHYLVPFGTPERKARYQSQIAEWAGILRNDPDGSAKLEKMLSEQRLQLFPNYTDPQATYDDIASIWRNVWYNLWGEQPNEKDPLFIDVVKDNDLTTATQTLLKEGLTRGIDDVVNRTLSDMLTAFGGNVPGAAI